MRAALVVLASRRSALPGAHALRRRPGRDRQLDPHRRDGPLTGPAAAFASVAPGADAYFRYVNDRGGVFGRKIRYKYVDDGFEVARTVDQTRRLVQQDRVFAIFNSIGTEQRSPFAPI